MDLPYKAALWVAACTAFNLIVSAKDPEAGLPRNVRSTLERMSGETLLADIKQLSSDRFEGRAPGTRGEEETLAYLTEKFRELGLKPGNPDGSYLQAVPLVGITAIAPAATLEYQGQPTALAFPQDCVIWSKRQVPEVQVKDSELLFVGYGIEAPEYGWNDFKDVDARGKTLLILINDPPVPDPKDPDELDPTMFKGRAMTYYGRWTYKFEMAARKEAAAAIIIHETGPAGYPWTVVVDSNGRENFDLSAGDSNSNRVMIEGWITLEATRKLLARTGFDFDTLKKLAAGKEFKPVSLHTQVNFSIKNQIRQVESHNVIARLEGSSRKLRGEHIIYTAHWDHLGRDPKLPGDPVYHGALDNASGVAGLLELARAYARLPAPPKRSVLFLSVTAEEKGLLGSKHYAAHPLYPLAQTLADFNMDGLNPWGRTRDLQIIGQGNSSLETLLATAASGQHRVVHPELQPERGYFYRSDHFEFAKAGVPALYFKAGTNYLGKSPQFGFQKLEEYTRNDYHKVTDRVNPEWDLSGAIEDLKLLFQVGWMVADSDDWPKWNPDSEFRARREKMLLKR